MVKSDRLLEIADRIKLQPFLLAHGFNCETGSQDVMPEAWQVITQQLIADVERYHEPLGIMNRLAGAAEGRLKSPELEPDEKSAEFLHLLNVFESEGLCYLQDNRITFRDEDSRFFINGGWLEDYTFSLVRSLRKQPDGHIQDIQKSLEVRALNGGSHNELDVVFLANNRLHVIECKTRQWQASDKGEQAIYKLDTLQESLGGLKGKGMLVTYRKMRKADLARADNENIAVCQYSQLKRLDEYVRNWIRA